MFRKCLITLLTLLAVSQVAELTAQAPRRWTSADIHHAIEKLNFLGSVLYVAAHPDDENTRLIAYLANEVKAETAYLSLTRGDGGQNLIGPEIRELLGVIRTQELLAARRTDGGNQMFSRANDFGYSQHPDETMRIWNKDEVLSDVVWAIRKWQPDIIINRFSHNSAGETHGHHTSSAILSLEAFDLAGQKKAYPAQLKYLEPWQPKRIYFNTTWWFYGSQEAFDKADKSNMISVDVGVYYPYRGKSNTEIAAESRSMHKCQGFGATLTRGSEIEYLDLLKGEKPAESGNLFAGINTTWTRVEGGAPIGQLFGEIIKEFRYEQPSASVPKLMRARKLIMGLRDGYWKRVKLAEVEEVIKACLGLFVEAAAEDHSATPGQIVNLNLEAINRSPVEVVLKSVRFLPQGKDTVLNLNLKNNMVQRLKYVLPLPETLKNTSPYWLSQPWELGMYTVEDQELRGLPQTPHEVQAQFQLLIAGEPLLVTSDVIYKRTDPVDGEVYRPFEITPPVFAGISEKVYVFADESPRSVQVKVRAGQAKLSGQVRLEAPKGWRVEPAAQAVSLAAKGQEQILSFQVFPPAAQSEGELKALVDVGGKTYRHELVLIDYDHIPAQTVLLESRSKIVKVDLRRAGQQIGYIMGAGDEIPAALQQMGYEVSLLGEGDVQPEKLGRFDAVILGVRAYNTVDWLRFKQSALLDYVKNGGTMIVQYNTNFRLVVPNEELAPYSMSLSRERVTVEEAPMTVLKPEHPVLNFPNKITQKDFDGWVQERGLYFPNKWDEERFEAIFSCNDPGEEPSRGSLLVAKHGSGYYLYTGLSFFRELPAGVPGAIRLFANMISIGQEERP